MLSFMLKLLSSTGIAVISFVFSPTSFPPMQNPCSLMMLTMWLGFWSLVWVPFWVLPSMEKSLRIFSPSLLFSISLKSCSRLSKYFLSIMVKARWMVSCDGMPFFRGMSVCRVCWCSSAKCCISTKLFALPIVANSARATMWFSWCFIFPCWRVSVLFMMVRFCRKLFVVLGCVFCMQFICVDCL